MSKKFRSQASSARAASSTFGGPSVAFGNPASPLQTTSSTLSYVTELPDLSGISDATIVVAFKNLTKRDSVTKARALEDLREILSTNPEAPPEQAVLEAWINIYPRTSIDNARRVRQLAHSLQGSITVSSGKRIAPQLPKVVGAWLAGTFDSDKSVSRAAVESFETAFTSVEKRQAVWRLYQAALLDYVEDAILKHTPQTLSDERTTSPDDAQAKYVRVISTALLSLDQLLQGDTSEKPISDNEIFQAIIRAKKTYELTSHEDSSVRRAVYRLVADIANKGVSLDCKLLGSSFLSKTLHISQLSSSAQYIIALLALTRARPTIWTTEHESKTGISQRLFQYLNHGSHRGPEAWWLHLRDLIKSIPVEAWSHDSNTRLERPSREATSQLLNALHEGVVSSDEPRQNLAAAWSTYMDIFFWSVDQMGDNEGQSIVVDSLLYPIIERYLFASPELSQWAVPAPIRLSLCSTAIIKVEGLSPLIVFEVFYKRMVDLLIESMKLSQPESSKTFKSSQDDIIQKARRFFELQSAVNFSQSAQVALGSIESGQDRLSLSAVFAQSNLHILQEAVKLLRERNGKPYGAAGVIYMALEKRPQTIEEVERSSTPQLLSELLENDTPNLLQSPSAEFLVLILLTCRAVASYEESFSVVLQQFMVDPTLQKSRAYGSLMRGIRGNDLLKHPPLKKQILQELHAALEGDDSRWPIVYDFLTNENLNEPSSVAEKRISHSVQVGVLEDLMSALAVDEKADHALKGMEYLVNRDPSLRLLLPSRVNPGTLLTRLFLLADSTDQLKSDKAGQLALLVKRTFATQGENGTGASAVEIIRRQLEGEGEALSILSLVEIAREALHDKGSNLDSQSKSALFPTSSQWQKALTPFLQLQPPPSLSLITPLQGCAFIVDRERRRSTGGLPRDSEGFSIGLRLAILVTKLIEDVSAEQLSPNQREALYLFYPQALQLVNDKLSIQSANALWIDSTEEVIQEMNEIVSKGQQIIKSWIPDAKIQNDADGQTTLVSCWLSQLPDIRGTSAQAFNLARTFATIMTEASDIIGSSKYLAIWDEPIRAIKSSAESMRSGALLAICREALASLAMGKRLCNELVADATDIDFDDQGDALRRLALLNLLIKGEEDVIEAVPSQRLIFLVKHLLAVPSFTHQTGGLQTELLSTLTSVLPAIKDLYGDFWQDTVTLLAQYLGSLSDASEIAPLYSALKLYACLSSLTRSDGNEDLEEEMLKAKPAFETHLLEILTYFEEASSAANQPLGITTALLARLAQSLTLEKPEEMAELYTLLSSEDGAVQGAAYGILHRSLPPIQEQLSIEAALSKTVPHLPEELLSLLLDAPSMDLFNSTPHSTDLVWVNIRRYLLSWKVVFDHFSTASHLVREAYLGSIKDHGHLNFLLSFICDVLRIATGKPIGTSKFDITNFTLDEESLLEKECQWLTVHLYYLSLLYLPSLTKSWWIEQKNRIKTPLETWSQRHICPHIISASLTTVSDWLLTQDDSEEHALSLKINPRASEVIASEVIASIPIDVESPSISLCITLPPTYPFATALVTSRARVAVSEQKWQSWLRTIQGIIMFSNGSLIDGLLAFRRNVQGALKGQSECAICYSVIGSDMKTPDKKCATCKNTFHSACLLRWFRSSNSSSCPLCRNAFHYA